MASLEDGKKVPAQFAANFMGTDQDVKDIGAAKPETRWALMELPKEQLEALEKGSTFYFQSQDGGTGVDDGGANLCTDNLTFGLEFLENSNSQFVAWITGGEGSPQGADKENVAPADEAMGQRCEVFGQVRGHLITKPAKVNVQRLRSLLEKQPLGVEPGAGAAMLTTRDIEYELAASAVELRSLLESGPYIEVDGVWRLLPTALEREILDTSVNLIAAKAWNAERLDLAALLEAVQQHLGKAAVPSSAVLRKVLKSFVKAPEPPAAETEKDSTAEKPAEGAKDSAAEKSAPETKADTPSGDGAAAAQDDEAWLCLDTEKIKHFKVLEVLQMPPAKVRDRFGLAVPEPKAKRARPASGRPAPVDVTGGAPLSIEEFAAVVQELTGAAEKPTVEEVWKAVGTNAYADEFEGTIHGLDARALPQEPRERLAKLFELQSHWNASRLAALVAPCLGAGQKVDVWLMKQTRAVFLELVQGKEERLLVKKFGM